jgi:hypothetical protein
MQSVFDVLARHGHLPRRVVVLTEGGDVGDLRDHPERPEIPALSKIADLVREARGWVVYSRDPGELLTACLTTSDPTAWMHLTDDIRCGLVPPAVFADQFASRPETAARFVTDVLAGAHDILTTVSVVYCLRSAAPHFTAPARSAFAMALRVHAAGFLDAVHDGVTSLPLRHRHGVLDFIGTCIPVDIMMAACFHGEDLPRDDDLRILMSCPGFPGGDADLAPLAHHLEALHRRQGEARAWQQQRRRRRQRQQRPRQQLAPTRTPSPARCARSLRSA